MKKSVIYLAIYKQTLSGTKLDVFYWVRKQSPIVPESISKWSISHLLGELNKSLSVTACGVCAASV